MFHLLCMQERMSMQIYSGIISVSYILNIKHSKTVKAGIHYMIFALICSVDGSALVVRSTLPDFGQIADQFCCKYTVYDDMYPFF